MLIRKFLNKIKLLAVIVSIVAMASTLTGCSDSLKNTSANVSGNSPDAYGMTTADVTKGDISLSITGAGSFLPSKSTNLSYYNISGKLKNLYVQQYGAITSGQVIAEIDSEEVNKSIIEQELVMRKWTIWKKQAAESLKMALEGLKIAKADLDAAQKAYDANKSDANKTALDREKLQYEQANSVYKNAQWNSQIQSIDYQQDLKQLNELKNKLTQTKLIAPFDGIAVYVDNISETEMIFSGQVIARVTEPRNIVLQTITNEARNIQGVKSAVLTIGNETFDVEIYTPMPGDLISTANDSASIQNRLYLSFVGKMPQFTFNKPIDIKLEIKKNSVILVPKAALNEKNNSITVDVLSGSQIKTVEVVRGIESDGMVEILSGLEVGSKVVIK